MSKFEIFVNMVTPKLKLQLVCELSHSIIFFWCQTLTVASVGSVGNSHIAITVVEDVLKALKLFFVGC